MSDRRFLESKITDRFFSSLLCEMKVQSLHQCLSHLSPVLSLCFSSPLSVVPRAASVVGTAAADQAALGTANRTSSIRHRVASHHAGLEASRDAEREQNKDRHGQTGDELGRVQSLVAASALCEVVQHCRWRDGLSVPSGSGSIIARRRRRCNRLDARRRLAHGDIDERAMCEHAPG